MYIVTFVSLIALLLTYLDSRKIFHGGLKFAFLLVTLLGCIHYDYGNDYMSYKAMYDQIIYYPFNFIDIINKEVFKEPGWVLLCYIFQPLGGFLVMVAFLNILQNYLIYRTLVNFSDRKMWTISMFVYLFNPSLYLMNFSMMRQGLVICVFFGIWNLIIERKIVKSLTIICLCSLIHTSSLVLIPFLFLGYLPLHNKKYCRIIAGGGLVVFLLFWFKGSLLNDLLSSVMNFDNLTQYVDNYGEINSKGVSLGLGFLLNQIPFILSLFYLVDKKTKGQELYSVLMATIGFVLIPFVLLLPIFSRISFYFAVYQILSIGFIYNNCSKNNKLFFNLLRITYVLLSILAYFQFFHSPIWKAGYSDFNTIFSLL